MRSPGPSECAVHEIRVATIHDLATLADIEQAAFGDSWSLGLLAAELDAVSRIVVVEEQGRGYATAAVVDDTADLMRIAVVPQAQRTGIARALFADIYARVVAAGARRLLLEVADDNAGAQAFYATLGFVAIGRRDRYYPGGQSAVVMELPLPQ